MTKYFDNCATTRVDDEVQAIITEYNTNKYFNPSALANACADVQKDIRQARQQIASLLGAQPQELYFTSGGTEADNLAIFGLVKNRKDCNIVVTRTEHSAVLNAVMHLKERGVEIRFADSTADGHIDTDSFVSCVDDKTVLAIMMHVNNETGAINDIKYLSSAVKAKCPKAYTFADGVQAVGKIDVNVKRLGVDAYSFSAHKIHGSKGCGALYVKQGITLSPILYGGGQESGVRSGTEYVGGIVSLAKAMQLAVNNLEQNTQNYLQYKEILQKYLQHIPFVKQNCTTNCAPHVLSLAFKAVRGEVLVHMLEDCGFVVGTSSACSAHSGVDRVFQAIGLDKDYLQGLIRISFCKYNTIEDVEQLGQALVEQVQKLRKLTGVKL